MGEIGAVVKVVDSHLCGWGSIPGKSCSLLIVSVSMGLSLCFMCSDPHVKYWMPRGFPLTSSLLLDYHIKQYIHTSSQVRSLSYKEGCAHLLSREKVSASWLNYGKNILLISF